MKFSLELGQMEKNTIEYDFNQLLGRLVISVNRQPIKKSVRLFSEPLREVHVFTVGQAEPYSVRIEKERKLLYGQVNRVFVDNRLVQCHDGV